jgi:mannose-6-phosphate isomerase-like protein (cupin superfamily)
MANRGDTVEHPVTGERITFLQTSAETNGEYATFELRVRPHGFVAAPHVHPHAVESFEIRSGTFTIVVDGHERRVGPGDGAAVPAGAAHAWWNSGDEEGVAIVEFRPGWKAEEFFESFFGLAQDGKVNPKTGLPKLLWLASIFCAYHDFGYIARPPLPVQRAVFAPLGAVAWLLGYRLPRSYPYASRASAHHPGTRTVREEIRM